jgi:hypothetical protein
MAGGVSYNEGTSSALVGAFGEMEGQLGAADGVLKAAYSELEAAHKGNSGITYRRGLDEINSGLVKVRHALETLRSGVLGTSKISTGAEESNLSLASQVGIGGTSMSSSWT